MVSRPTIFSEVVFRRGLKPEDAATDGLAFLLSANREVARVFQQYVERITGLRLPPLVLFEAQVSQQGMERPDIVASTGEGSQLLFIENKFWAGLTENQPVQYLKDLIRHSGVLDAAVLVFVCPERSSAMYWDELNRRVKEDRELALMNACGGAPSGASTLVRRFGERLALAVIPWRRLLELLSQAAADAGDRGIVEDVVQLRSLVERVDEEQAFLPLRSEELGAEFGKRWRQYEQLQWQLNTKLAGEPYRMGRYQNSLKLDLGGSGKWQASWIGINLDLWGRYGMTPFWLVVGRWLPHYALVRRTLHTWLADSPPRAFECKLGGQDYLCVPLVPPLGVGKDNVPRDLAAQVAAVRDAIATAGEQATEAVQYDRPPAGLSGEALEDTTSGTQALPEGQSDQTEARATPDDDPTNMR